MSFEVPFIRPQFPSGADFAMDYEEIVRSGWFSNFGPVERRFARGIAEYLGRDLHAATIANATAGLMAVVATVFDERRRGSWVLTPSFTFAAGAHAIEWGGFRPLFVDVDPVTLQPSLAHARRVVSEFGDDIAGVLFCNTFGIGDSSIDAWESAAAEWELPMIVDSAAGFGSRYADGKKLGGRGLCEVFSFHATKPFAVGEGGAVVTRDSGLIEKVHAFQNFGFGESRRAEARGLNAKMSEFTAALGIRQFAGFDDSLRSRQEVVDQYAGSIAGTDAHLVPGIERSSVCFATLIVDDQRQMARTCSELEKAGIEFRRYYNPPVHQHDRFRALSREELPETEAVCAKVLSLPVHAYMDTKAVDLVSQALSNGSR